MKRKIRNSNTCSVVKKRARLGDGKSSIHQRPQSSPNEAETTYTSFSPKSPPPLDLHGRRRKENAILVCMFSRFIRSDAATALQGRADESADTRSRLNPLTQSEKYSEAFSKRIQTQAQSGWTTDLISSPRPFLDQSKQ